MIRQARIQPAVFSLAAGRVLSLLLMNRVAAPTPARREVDLAPELASIQCLGLSPDDDRDGIAFAATEASVSWLAVSSRQCFLCG